MSLTIQERANKQKLPLNTESNFLGVLYAGRIVNCNQNEELEMLRYYLQCSKVTGYCFLIEHEIKLSVSHKQRQLWTSTLFQLSFYLQMLLVAQLNLTRTMFSGLNPLAVVAQLLKYFWHQFLPTDWQSTYDLHFQQLPFNALRCGVLT